MSTRVKQTFCGSQWRSDAPLKIKSSLIKQIIHLLYFQHNAKQEKKPRCAIICYRAHYATWQRTRLGSASGQDVATVSNRKQLLLFQLQLSGWLDSLAHSPLASRGCEPRVSLTLSRGGAVAGLIPQKALKFQVANQPVDGAPRELHFNCLWV